MLRLLLNHFDLEMMLVEDFFFVGMKHAAYSLEEVEEKTRSFRESAKYAAGDGATALDVSIDYFSGFLHFHSSLLILCFRIIFGV